MEFTHIALNLILKIKEKLIDENLIFMCYCLLCFMQPIIKYAIINKTLIYKGKPQFNFLLIFFVEPKHVFIVL